LYANGASSARPFGDEQRGADPRRDGQVQLRRLGDPLGRQASAVPERLNRAFDDPPDRAVFPANGPAARRIQLGPFRRHRLLAATDPPGHDGHGSTKSAFVKNAASRLCWSHA
jgi:hypothetical protein